MTLTGLTDQQIQFSPYLRDLADRDYPRDNLDDLSAKIATADADGLRVLKSQFSLQFSRTDFPTFDAAGEIWSAFAERTIDRALDLAWAQTAKRHRIKLPAGNAPGLFILGLGKLGGRDLNFSSDVDLIAFYDPDTLPVPKRMGQAFISSEVCKNLTQILQPRNAPDFVWRVDWRLRPESSGTGLAMSTSKAETFYFFRSLPWHRLALMKARCVAGGRDAGAEFLGRLEPYIWRRNLDFTTLDQLAALKTRINNEHPGLQNERAAPDPITPRAEGFNLKLGRGGIREIEFIANAQQLIHGGKRPALRVTHTRTALSQLADANLLSVEDSESLREDYSFFRQAENAVQMLANEQTHIVPGGEDLTSLLALLGHPADFDQTIYTRRRRVHEMFADLFADAPVQQTSLDLSSLEGPAKNIAMSWRNGFQQHGLSLIGQNKFKGLGHRLTERALSQSREDQAFQRIDSFLKQIGRSEQYFALLNRHPELADRLISPLLHSPHMSEILEQSPHIIDIFIAANPGSLEAQSRFVLVSPDYENRLEALRRFVNEQLFLSYSQFLEGSLTNKETQAKLTALAEQTLTLSIQIVCEDLGLSDVPLTVLGLGKMGTQAMAPQSDLDLIFIFGDDVKTELATKIVRRLRTTLTVELREGIAYELDMRLRPSGRSGPPAVKLASFREHHMKRAHSWEHIALAPARIVAGDKALGDKVMKIKAEIFARPRDLEAFKSDALAMYRRLSEERLQDTPPDVWRSKLRTGGLMAGDYLRSCHVVSGQPADTELLAATEDWNALQMWERLLGLKGKSITETPPRFAEAIDLSILSDRQSQLEQKVNKSLEGFFNEAEKTPLPDPRPIMWKN